MKQAWIVIPVGVILIGLFLLTEKPANGGCHGGCVIGTGIAANPCNGSTIRSVRPPLDVLTTGDDPPTDLELYSIPLTTDGGSESIIFSGEVTSFYVASGTITFTVDSDAAPGTVRFVDSSGATPEAVDGGDIVVAGGESLFVDAQSVTLHLVYQNSGSEEAVLMITSAVPCVPASVTPAIQLTEAAAEQTQEVKT
ncbi:MAG: hypothetical protein QOJ59_4966 [Thermomicrobiales bacterium]|jgi:hypothetical protein|nr:hypothetical protein [Thermomicrobiales bacterium]MEA2527749.1 hypothetical protein [Thermomicrobiales bacterium]